MYYNNLIFFFNGGLRFLVLGVWMTVAHAQTPTPASSPGRFEVSLGHFSQTPTGQDSLLPCQITVETTDGRPLDDWAYCILPANNTDTSAAVRGKSASATGVVSFGCSPREKELKITVNATHNPLDGVNIWDLIQISQYIFGVKSLSGYQLLAADASHDGRITALDLAQLRKLLLGIYPTLPSKNAWYFYDKKQHRQMNERANPFPLIGDSSNAAPNISAPDEPYHGAFVRLFLQPHRPIEDRTAAFIGVKVGDMDNTVAPDSVDRDQIPWAMATTAHRGKKGSVITIPVVSNRSGSIQGWQMDLNFDPNVLAIEEVEWPAHSMPQPENKGWNLNAEGNIRLIWWDAVAPLSVTPGVPVCQIKVRLLRDIAAESPLLQPNRSAGIPNLVFDQTGKEFGLQWENIPAEMVKTAPVNTPRLEIALYPNPTQRHYRINIQSPTEQTGTITILDLNGKPLSEKTISLNTGINTITSAQWPVPLAPGTYTIQVQTDNDRQQIRFVRL